MTSLKTTTGKEIKLSKVEIEICPNNLIDSGYSVSIKMIGKLPKCRKESILYLTHGYTGKDVSLTTLYGNRSYHSVLKTDFINLVETTPVVYKSYVPYIKKEASTELITFAKKYLKEIYGE